MSDPHPSNLDALALLTVPQLLDRHQILFGRPAVSRNRRHLMRLVAWGLQAAQGKTLSERARRRAATLVDPADLRLDSVMKKSSKEKPPKSRHRLLPGAVLVRQYRGQTVQVDVLEDGFRYDGAHYRTLTAVVRKITGAHWNGFHFFGLTPQQRKSR